MQIVSVFLKYLGKVISPKLLESFSCTGLQYAYLYPLYIVDSASHFYTPQWTEIQVIHFVSPYIYTAQS